MPRYKVPELSTYEWQKSVQSVLSSPPISPTKGDRYIIGLNATGVWVDKTGQIVEYDEDWEYTTPSEGWIVYVIDFHRLISYGSTDWEEGLIANGRYVFETTNVGKTLTKYDFGKTLTCKNASNQTFILPVITNDIISHWYRFIKLGVGNLRINASGTDIIVDSVPGGYIINSKSFQPWATLCLVAVDIGQWSIFDGFGTWDTN